MSGTGTHDNETTVGWWNDSAQDAEKEYIKRYLHTNGKDIAGDFMRESFKSVSKTSIVMLQVTCATAVSTCDGNMQHRTHAYQVCSLPGFPFQTGW